MLTRKCQIEVTNSVSMLDCPGNRDTFQLLIEACSNASGLTPPRWL
jgi:hypothetical protein